MFKRNLATGTAGNIHPRIGADLRVGLYIIHPRDPTENVYLSRGMLYTRGHLDRHIVSTGHPNIIILYHEFSRTACTEVTISMCGVRTTMRSCNTPCPCPSEKESKCEKIGVGILNCE